jgi:hypothetical protein
VKDILSKVIPILGLPISPYGICIYCIKRNRLKINCIYCSKVINYKDYLGSLQKTCPKCSRHFECLESTGCWCFHLDRYWQVDTSINDCICNDCLLTGDYLSNFLQKAHKQVKPNYTRYS